MEILCTRPGCRQPHNSFSDLDDPTNLKTVQQKYCTTCGMHLILAGRYLPEKLLGQGGFGTAFLARDRHTPTMRFCVVKQFQPLGNLDDQQLALAQELFEREAHVLERIGNRHPQIPDLYAFFPLIVPNPQGTGQDRYFYLVQEYIDGEDLEHELARCGKLAAAEVRQILVSMLAVLDFVHSEGTIHRDIKPSNIMRSRDGTLHLLDFGAVKEVTAGAGVVSTSQRSTGIYSPGYAPPEQMRGAQVYPATDLYALAVTCIVLLTGEQPDTLFDGYRNVWQWRKFVTPEPDFAAVLDEMLTATPGDRPHSAQEVLALLQVQPTGTPAAMATPTTLQVQQQTPPKTPQATHSPSKPPKPAQPSGQTPSAKGTPKPAPAQSAASAGSSSVIPLLMGAAFTGFEGTLLFFIVGNVLGGTISIGIWGAMMGGLIFALSRKSIETTEMIIFAVIAVLLALFLVKNMPLITLLILAVIIGAALVAAIALFTLIYRILQKVF